MDQARRIRVDEEEVNAPEPARGADHARTAEQMAEGLEKVLRFSIPSRADGDRNPTITARDFATAIDIVHEAAESMKAAESRARDADSRTQALAQRATEELKSAEARVQAAEARALSAEIRAHDAEARLKEAESWLRQIFSTISEEFPVRR